MSNEQVDDLKQFVDSRLSQTEEHLGERIDKLEKKMQDGFAGVGEVIESIHEQSVRFDLRITKLEQAA